MAERKEIPMAAMKEIQTAERMAPSKDTNSADPSALLKADR